MRTSTAVVLLITAFILGYMFGALASPVREYVFMTTTETESIEITTTITERALGGAVSEICFSAIMDCSSIIQRYIERANHSIYVMVYSFTQDELGKALVSAARRGVEVVVVVEGNQVSEYSEVERLRNAGVKVFLDGNPFLMHHKVAIIDGVFVITGSYNWSRSAEDRNDENVVVLRGEHVATLFIEEFNRVLSEAIPA